MIEVVKITYPMGPPPPTKFYEKKFEFLKKGEIPMKKGKYSKVIHPNWCKNGQESIKVFFIYHKDGSNDNFDDDLSNMVKNFKAINNSDIDKVWRVSCNPNGGRKRKRRRKTKRKMKRKSKRKMKRKTKRRRKRRRRR